MNDADDLYYDAGRKRMYVPGGEGFISVIQQIDADRYRALANIPTTVGARTGLWYEKRDRFYLAVPASSKQGAALWVYAPGGLSEYHKKIPCDLLGCGRFRDWVLISTAFPRTRILHKAQPALKMTRPGHRSRLRGAHGRGAPRISPVSPSSRAANSWRREAIRASRLCRPSAGM